MDYEERLARLRKESKKINRVVEGLISRFSRKYDVARKMQRDLYAFDPHCWEKTTISGRSFSPVGLDSQLESAPNPSQMLHILNEAMNLYGSLLYQ